MECQLFTPEALRRHLRKQQCGGQSAFARALDYITLRAVLFLCAYLICAPRFPRTAALLLSTVALAACMLALRVVRQISLARFAARQTDKVRRQLLSDRLMLLPMQRILPLVSSLCPMGETPVVLQHALPVDANALLQLIRAHPCAGKLHVFSCTPFDLSAAAFAVRTNGMLVLHAVSELLEAGQNAGLAPDEHEVNLFFAAEMEQQRARRNRSRPSPFAAGSARKYLLLSLALFGLSFAVEYALYYRLLSGFCMTLAACGGLRYARHNAA